MAARPAILKQSELTRYAKAMQKAGVPEWRVVARPDGSHEIVAGRVVNNLQIGPNPDELLK
jgi:hypothetical protein